MQGKIKKNNYVRLKSLGLIVLGGVIGFAIFYALPSDENKQSNTGKNANEKAKKPLYWVAPMDPNYKRDQPGKSPMGMDLVPVYAESSMANGVKISPEVMNNIGVQVEPVKYRSLRINISGDNLAEIQVLGGKIEKLLNRLPNTTSVYADRSEGGRYINIDINRKKAANYGLSIAEIQSLISMAVGGMNITETIEGLERYPVNLRFPQYDRDSLEKLKALPIVTPTGAHIALSEVADIYIDKGAPMIKSENGRLTGLVLVDIKGDVGSYIQQAQALLDQSLQLPTGYSLSFSGQYEYMQRANQQLLKVVPIAVAIILLLLYLSFRRVADVLMIVLTLPLSIVGGIWLIYLLNYNLSVAVGVGFIALAGVAIEIGVLMLVYMNQTIQSLNRDKLTEDDIKRAIIEGALLRVRPITMTVATVIIGLIPIMFATGTGSEVMQRIATPVVGGMISATILALLLLPAVYYVYQKRRLLK